MMMSRQKAAGIRRIGAFADVREIAKAQVRAWELQQRFGQCYLVGGTKAAFGPGAPRGQNAGPAHAQKRIPAVGADAGGPRQRSCSPASRPRARRHPESARLTSYTLLVNSSKGRARAEHIPRRRSMYCWRIRWHG